MSNNPMNNPIIDDMKQCKEILWVNSRAGEAADLPFSMADIDDAERRLKRFAPYIMAAFPETEVTGGIIESPLKEISAMKALMEGDAGAELPGRLFLKCDSHLAVSGSIKARGGIYEVLKFAEEVAMKEGLLNEDDDYSILIEDRFR